MPVPKFKPPEPTRASKESIRKLARDVTVKYGYRPEKPISTLVTALGGTWGYGDAKATHFLTVSGPRNFGILVPRHLDTQQASYFLARMLGHYVLHSRVGKKAILILEGLDNLLDQEASWFAETLLSEPPSLSALDRILSEYDPFQQKT